MRQLRYFLLILAFALGACHDVPEYANDVYGNFDALWTALDTHYCFFKEKDVDWDAVGKKYRAQLNEQMNEKELFAVCADMLNELRDGHTNLASWFDVSYYRKWWSDYPANFNWRRIQENYLHFDYASQGGFNYAILPDCNVGYIRYASFGTYSDGLLNDILYSMRETDGIIIDIRDNGGGIVTNATKMVGHFIDERRLIGYIRHKTGPGHNDFSDPYPVYADPSEGVVWLKRVVVLTNRGTFSAANEFASQMRNLPHVRLVGTRTGGGSGMPFSSQTPNGWTVRFSASPTYDSRMELSEHGVIPHIDVTTSPSTPLDSMLQTAIQTIKSK